MQVCLIEPFFCGSHAEWAKGYKRYSRHEVNLLTMSGHHWKWRMHGAAVTMGKKILRTENRPDLILATDMLDLATFLGLARKETAAIPTAIYFHENQLTYPWSPQDLDTRFKRDAHYGFINFTSALAADRVLFNSNFHLTSFLKQLPKFLQLFPDHNELDRVEHLVKKSSVLPLGLDLSRFDSHRPKRSNKQEQPPLILWNHRWEYDKNPEEFFEALFHLHNEGHTFQIALLGESYRKKPKIFDIARERLKDRILYEGYVPNFKDYARWLWAADILPVTSYHDFFGRSVIEAIYCNCIPLLPNRLSYPEHIPKNWQDLCLYNSSEDFQGKLGHLLTRRPDTKEELRKHVKRYDWRSLAGKYDALLDAMSDKGF